jgi:hypothetical protein
MYYPSQPAPMPDDVSPLEASRERQFLAALLSGRISPALRQTAYRNDSPERATRPLNLGAQPVGQPLPQTQDLSETSRLRARA